MIKNKSKKYIFLLSLFFIQTNLISDTNISNIDLVKELKNEFINDVINKNIIYDLNKYQIDKKCFKDKSDNSCQNEIIEEILKKEDYNFDEYIKKQKEYFLKIGISFEDFFYKKEIKLEDEEYYKKIKENIKNKIYFEKEQEFITAIDIEKQIIIILLYNKINDEFDLIGVDLISSGNELKEYKRTKDEGHYFETPKGIFEEKGGWRAEGTFNKNGIKGFGEKDRYVFYFGEIEQERISVLHNRKIKDKLNFGIHAHNSSTNVFGKKGSKGCVRTTNFLNEFMDYNYILHKNNINENGEWINKNIKAPNIKKYQGITGSKIYVF